jgi:electron transport complex protein RnfB
MNENFLILTGMGNSAKVKGSPLVDQIDAILPQTQCNQCDFQGCRPYAEAIENGNAEINQCPPGGQEGVDALAELLGVEPLLLNEEHGETKPKRIALVNEKVCIGCTLCIKACPVDAFVGSSKVMTQVIAEECTGCDLCLPVCPVDCIEMIEVKSANPIPFINYYQFYEELYKKQTQEKKQRETAKGRFEFREMRLERNKQERSDLLEARMIALKEKMSKDKVQKEKIDAAMRRVNASKVNNEVK